MCVERDKKWVAVEPGHIIPAGQPYMIEFKLGMGWSVGLRRSEYVLDKDKVVIEYNSVSGWFVDSSWRPPLELPTEPTWGIVVYDYQAFTAPYFGKWERNDRKNTLVNVRSEESYFLPISGSLDFIKCTPEQVARLEGKR